MYLVHRKSLGPWPLRETMYHEECMYTAFCMAVVFQSIHLFQSHCIVLSCHQIIVYFVAFLHTSLAFHVIPSTCLSPNIPPSSSPWPSILAAVLPRLPHHRQRGHQDQPCQKDERSQKQTSFSSRIEKGEYTKRVQKPAHGRNARGYVWVDETPGTTPSHRQARFHTCNTPTFPSCDYRDATSVYSSRIGC